MDNIVHLKKKTVISALSLFFQSGYSAFLGLVANLVVTILLSPAIFGIYITALSIISLFNYFSDIGLAASLVQKKEITDEDIRTTFTVQQLLIIAIITVGFFATSFIRQFYKLPAEGVQLYWALLLAFFLSSLKTMPSIFLERQVQFQKIVLVQVIENTVFYLTVIIFAILKFGLASFTIAVICRSVIGVIVIYSISFWKPAVGISRVSLKKLLTFGVPFQASSFLALFKDDLITLYLGKVLGFTGLGYIGWAKKWAEAPIRIVMDNVSRVLFPVLARLQHDKEKIGQLIEKNLYYQTMLLAPIMFGMIILMKPFVQFIPRYSKWLPALPLFYLMSIAAFFSSYSTPFTNLFNALGKAKISFFFMLFWTGITWILTPILTHTYGYFGFPITQVVLSLAFVLVLFQAKRLVNFRFWPAVYKTIIASMIMGAITVIIRLIDLPIIVTLIVVTLTGFICYLSILFFLFKINVIEEVKSLFHYE